MNIDRSKIVAKIRALLSKTEENGCTESEMLAAVALARKMMDAYEVTAADVELKGESAQIINDGTADKYGLRGFLSVPVGRFTDTRTWSAREGGISFCGLDSDIEFVRWLLDSLANFVERELAAHLRRSTIAQGNRRRLINGFIIGAVSRISERLDAIKAESRVVSTSNSRALVVSKGRLVSTAMTAAGINLKSRTSRRRSDAGSYVAGRAAGDRASFGRPVGGQGAVLRLGR